MGAERLKQSGSPSLAKKALVATSIVMICHFVVSYLILSGVVSVAFQSLEDSIARENIARVRDTLAAELESLGTINLDWASWDATHRFALGTNPSFPAEHVPDSILSTLKVSSLFLLDRDGNLLLMRDGDGFLAATSNSPSVDFGEFAHMSETSNIRGLLRFGENLFLVSSLPLLNNEHQGPVAGSLTLAQIIDERFIRDIASRVHVDFDVLTATEVPLEMNPRCSADYRCDYQNLEDLDGKVTAILSVHTPMDVFRLGSRALNIALALLAISSIAYLALSWVFLRSVVLTPLSKLARYIRHMTASGDLTQRLQLQGEGEIGIVAQNLNALTDSLEKADQRIRYLAFNDVLTGLPNRRQLDNRLQQAINEVNENQLCLALLFIDLDRFKQVNDTLNHSMGDKLLTAAAVRLRQCVRTPHATEDCRRNKKNFLARVGGDEFVLAIFDEINVRDVCNIARRVIEVLEDPFVIDSEKLHVSASVGISSFPKDGESVDALLKHADIAMYRAKESGGGSYHTYNSALDAAYHERIALEKELRLALERGQLELFYQPQVDFGLGRVIGCEALIRWRHPKYGLVSPAEFIPLAEENGSIEPIGRWVLQQACRQLRIWADAGFGELKVAVNVSPKQFRRGDLVDDVRRALTENGIDGRFLTIEITETSVMQHPDEVAKVLRKLKSLGTTIALDDFGTGYSSLSHLRRLPIDVIKIDRSFVDDLATNAEDAALVATIIAMGHSLNREVLAEGVETVEQVALLRAEGCKAMQGYLFSKPVPAQQFLDYLQRPITEILLEKETEQQIAQLAGQQSVALQS